MAGTKPPRPPLGLGVRGKKLWKDVTVEFVLRPDELSTLHELCRCLDVIDQVETELRGAPLTVAGSAGQVAANPLLNQLRGFQANAAQLSRLLALSDVPDVDEQGQPQPTPKTIRARRAAEARWGHRGRA